MSDLPDHEKANEIERAAESIVDDATVKSATIKLFDQFRSIVGAQGDKGAPAIDELDIFLTQIELTDPFKKNSSQGGSGDMDKDIDEGEEK